MTSRIIVSVSPETATIADDVDHAGSVAKLFAETFETGSVGPDDNFFQMGGDSLLAATLMAGIERKFGVALSISALLEAPTPRELAAGILEATIERAGDALVSVREAGGGPPICCVHGMRGVTMFPHQLVSELHGLRPVYGFRAIGLQPGEAPLETVKQIAGNYIAALKRVRESGPYVFLGHCGGSLIAYEMAQQSIAGGETVPGVILIDPLAHQDTAPFLFSSGLALRLAQNRWLKLAEAIRARFDHATEMARDKRYIRVRAALYAAVARYVPKPFGGKTLLLCTSERKEALLNPERGFPSFAPDCEVVEIRSGHRGMFDHPETVKAIEVFLDRVAPLGSASEGNS